MLLPYIVILVIFTTKTFTFDHQCEGDHCPYFLKPQQSPFIMPTEANTIFLGQDPTNGCYCRDLPGIMTVCFGRQTCTSLPIHLKMTSPLLRITETLVRVLKPGDFGTVQHLTELQLEGNSILKEVLPGTFENMSNIVNMSLSYNENLMSFHRLSFEGLANLRHLYLNKNGFQNLAFITPSLGVEVLPNLSRLSIDSNNFSYIRATDFEPMVNSPLKELSLGLCRIVNIDSKAFLPLRNLEQIQLPENRISTDIFTKLLKETINSKINLKMMNLFSFGLKSFIPKSLLEVIARSNITNLNLARNHFEELTKDSFPFMPNIEVLDLSEVLLLSISDDAFENLPNLKILLVSANKLVNIPMGVLRQSLIYLDLQENSEGPLFSSYFMLKNSQFFNMKNLIYLNLGYNTIPHLFNTSFEGLGGLKTLVLKNLTLFHAEKATFAPLKNLEYLNLENNAIDHGKYVPDIFYPLEKLKALKLSGCQFKYISTNEVNPFQNLKSLEKLELDYNFLTVLSPNDFKPLKSLTYIDLRKNYLTIWNESIFISNTELQTILLDKNKISIINSAMLQDFLNVTTVNLDLTGFVCACIVVAPALENIKTNVSILRSILKPDVFCTYPEDYSNITLAQYYENVQSHKVPCKAKPKKYLMFLPLIVFLIIVIGSAILGWYFRWQLKYLFFLTRLHFSRKGKIKSKPHKGYDNFMYDAFVSYCSEDTDFVLKLGTILENFPPYFKLCVYDRDFLGGVCISEAILVSIERSRKTLLVVSDNYAKSHWCRWESHIAEHHRIHMGAENGAYFDDTLILLKIGEIHKTHMTPMLKYLLKTRVYLEWTEEENKQKVFWEKLINALGNPIPHKEITKL